MQLFQGRRACLIENEYLRIAILEGGGHIAAIVDKQSGVSPLWIPPWPSIEPSDFNAEHTSLYGAGSEAKLLASIMGHNLCLDIFGGPSDEEAAAGLTAHGEASLVRYRFDGSGQSVTMVADFPLAAIAFQRHVALEERGVRIHEIVENRGGTDRPIGWTQHVTLGPPYLEKGVTEFRLSATRSKVFEGTFGPADYLMSGAEFNWPHAPLTTGGTTDLRVCNQAATSTAYTAHLLDPSLADAFFVAFSPSTRLAFGYIWRRSDFPWVGIWEENNSRSQAPWSGRTFTRAMEFGVSPFPEDRRSMVERGRLFGRPTYRWLPAKSRVEAEYWAILRPAERIPERIERPWERDSNERRPGLKTRPTRTKGSRV
jgi:hypothetical protein